MTPRTSERARGRVVVVTGATGETGRATAALLSARGDHVIAVGTDADRLAQVEAAERVVADLVLAEGAATLGREVGERHDHVDGLFHLVGGWKPGWGDEVTDWLNARLVTSLLNASTALEPLLLASPDARLAIVSSSAVSHDGPPSSAYTAAKLAAESWVEQLAARWEGSSAAAVALVVRSIGSDSADATATPPESVARHLIELWDRPAAELNGAHIPL